MKKLILSLASLALLSGCPTAPNSPPAAPVASVDPFWPTDGVFPGKGHTSSWTGFRSKNVERRSLFAQHIADDQDGIVFVGDSITEGWVTLAQDFADLHLKVVNRGIGGDTTPNLLYRLKADILVLHPRALVVLIGTNDLGEHTSPEDIAGNLQVFLKEVRAAYPQIPIAWCLVMPRAANDTYPERIRALNLLIVKIAATDPNVTICDTFAPFALPDGTSKPEDFRTDHLHLNTDGYAVWKSVLDPVLHGWNLDTK